MGSVVYKKKQVRERERSKKETTRFSVGPVCMGFTFNIVSQKSLPRGAL